MRPLLIGLLCLVLSFACCVPVEAGGLVSRAGQNLLDRASQLSRQRQRELERELALLRALERQRLRNDFARDGYGSLQRREFRRGRDCR